MPYIINKYQERVLKLLKSIPRYDSSTYGERFCHLQACRIMQHAESGFFCKIIPFENLRFFYNYFTSRNDAVSHLHVEVNKLIGDLLHIYPPMLLEDGSVQFTWRR